MQPPLLLQPLEVVLLLQALAPRQTLPLEAEAVAAAMNGIPRKWIDSVSTIPFALRRILCAAGAPRQNRCATIGAAGRSLQLAMGRAQPQVQWVKLPTETTTVVAAPHSMVQLDAVLPGQAPTVLPALMPL